MAEKQPEKAQDPGPPPRLHSFVDVIAGEYDGLLGSLEKIDGEYALVRTRDHKSKFPALVTVLLAHLKQSEHTGGR